MFSNILLGNWHLVERNSSIIKNVKYHLQIVWWLKLILQVDHWYIIRIITVLEWKPEEHQLQYDNNLKTVHWEQLFGVYRLRNNVWIHNTFHKFTYAIVSTSNLRAKLYQKLLISQGKPLSILTMDLPQKLYRYQVLLKVTHMPRAIRAKTRLIIV